MKKLSIALSIGVLVLAGCGDSESKTSQESTSAPKIKVTQGAIKETKVQDESKKAGGGKFYYTYNKEKNSSNKQRVRTTLDAYLNIRSPYERIQVELMIKKLSKDFVIKCSPCHDDYANGVIGPSLLGKSGDFIYQRIMDFKSGKRKNVLMKQLVAKIDDTKLKSIADEIAEFNKQIQELRRGRK
jgi:cytochrome c553